MTTMKWTRGHGYYNSHDHKVPLKWEEFKPTGCDKTIRKHRYLAYLISWLLKHGPTPLDTLVLSDKPTNQAKIEEQLQELLDAATELRDAETKGKGRKKGRSKTKR